MLMGSALQLSIIRTSGRRIVQSLLSKNLFLQRLRKLMLGLKVHFIFCVLMVIFVSFFSLMDVFAAEITMLENNIIVYKFIQDLHFFVTGGDEENELILTTVLQGFFDAITLLLRLISRWGWNFTLLHISRACADWYFFFGSILGDLGTMWTKERH